MNLPGVILLLFFAFSSVSLETFARQTFRCSKCGGEMVQCPKCHRFKHLPKSPAEGSQNPRQNLGQSSIAPSGGQPGSHSQSQPIAMGRQNAGPQSGPSNSVIQNPEEQHQQAHSEPERGLSSLSDLGPRNGVTPEQSTTSKPIGLFYKVKGDPNDPSQVNGCNGFLAGKHQEQDGVSCVFPIGTAHHCLTKGPSERKGPRTNTETLEAPFGPSWIQTVEINGESYTPLAFSRQDQQTRRRGDAAIMVIKAKCSDFPDDMVSEIDPNPPTGGSLDFWKSDMWKTMDGTLGYGNKGREWHAQNVAGKKLQASAGQFYPEPNAEPMAVVKLAGGDTIEPGDSGLPVAQNGKVVGILSGFGGAPPFSEFFYFPGSQMKWMKEELEGSFGSSVVSKPRQERSLAQR